MARRYWDGGNDDGADSNFRCDDDGDEGGGAWVYKEGEQLQGVGGGGRSLAAEVGV